MAKAFETILPGFTPSALQRAAIERIAEYKKELKGYGMYVRSAMELEFMVQDEHGVLAPGIIDLNKAHAYLTLGESLPYIEKVDVEGEVGRGMKMPHMATQYEINIADDVGQPARQLAPENVAAVAERLKTRSLKDMLLDSSNLTPLAATRNTGFHPNFEPRPHADEPPESILHNTETSSIHVNVSLCDKHGRNLFAQSEKLLDHCTRALVALQDEAALPMLPGDESLKRINANRSAPGGIGVKTGKRFMDSRHTSVTVRRYLLDDMPYIPEAEQTRIENRLCGSDADPFVAMAVTMAALVDAVRKHVHKQDDPVNQKVNLRIDPIPAGNYPCHDIPKAHSEIVEKFESSLRVRELLGDTFYNAILAEYRGNNLSLAH